MVISYSLHKVLFPIISTLDRLMVKSRKGGFSLFHLKKKKKDSLKVVKFYKTPLKIISLLLSHLCVTVPVPL